MKAAARAGRWKAVRLQVKKDPNGPLELYDLQQDPHEEHNVAASHPDIIKKMSGYMREAHVESAVFPFIAR